MNSITDASEWPLGIGFITSMCFKLLRAPIGSEAFCRWYVATEHADLAIQSLQKLGELRDVHAVYKVPSSCP